MMDILQNSIRAHATRIVVEIEEDTLQNTYRMVFSDNGRGMCAEMLEQVTDPFFTTRTTRKVGIGLSLLKQNAEQSGGHLAIESEEGRGTRVTAQFAHDHLDRPVAGDIAGTIALSMVANPGIEIEYSHRINALTFSISSHEVAAALDNIPISDPVVYPCVAEMIRENLTAIGSN